MLGFFESAVVFLAGLAVRLLLLALVVAALAVPILLAFEAWGGLRALMRRFRGIQEVGGLPWRSGPRYAPTHTWIAGEDRRVKVGLDGLAEHLVPTVQDIQLPAAGDTVRQGDVVARISSGTRRLAIVSPVSGRVSAVNLALAEDPAAILRDPYVGGWLFSVEPSDRRWEALPRGPEARDWFRRETERLHRLLESHLGIAAADGGEMIVPPASSLSDVQWEALTAEFLQPAAGE